MNVEHDLDRRLTRVENETVHIYTLIDERTTALAAGISDVRATLTEHGRRLDHIDGTLDEHGRRLDHIDGTLDEILRRLPEPSA